MTPPGARPGPTPTIERPRSSAATSVAAEVLHQHLRERVAAAKEELRLLEERRQAPEALVSRFGATVAGAQRELAEARAAAEAEVRDLVAAARVQADAIVEAAEGEARILRAVAIWLGRVPVLGELAPAAGPHRAVGPAAASLEARAS